VACFDPSDRVIVLSLPVTPGPAVADPVTGGQYAAQAPLVSTVVPLIVVVFSTVPAGEWLRCEDRRVEARKHLQVAHGMLQEMKIGAFGDRAGRGLAAASGARRARPPRIPSVGDELTEQEAQIARLAQAGLSNPEIGTRLFISARTVQYHLGKVFTKLGITSRNQLQWALSARREPVPVWAVTTAS